MKIHEIKKLLAKDELAANYQMLYLAGADTNKYNQRFLSLVEKFESSFSKEDIFLFSTPGRSEIIGNHTDHQNGKVIAASINLDMIAVAALNNNVIEVISEAEMIGPLEISELHPKQEEVNTSQALIRGVVARFAQLGYNYGGFQAVMTSDVLIGSGLSSSAAFEVMIGSILNHLYNGGTIPAVELAKIGQYSENVYFDKPSGLMDQMACAVGDLVYIDFFDNNDPQIIQLQSILERNNYKLCVVNTGGSHANLSGEYGSIVAEMKSVANYFGKQLLSELDFTQFYENIGSLRKEVSDRAVLRAIHYDTEISRVDEMKEAILKHSIVDFLRLVEASGISSFCYLQNVVLVQNVSEQNLSLALALSDRLLTGKGVSRVHGGGFAGTIQAFVPDEMVSEYQQEMEKVFGSGSCEILSIRPIGTCCLVNSMEVLDVSDC